MKKKKKNHLHLMKRTIKIHKDTSYLPHITSFTENTNRRITLYVMPEDSLCNTC